MIEVKKEKAKMYVVTINNGRDEIDFVFDMMCTASAFADSCIDHIVPTDSPYYKDSKIKVSITIKDVVTEVEAEPENEPTNEETEEYTEEDDA